MNYLYLLNTLFYMYAKLKVFIKNEKVQKNFDK